MSREVVSALPERRRCPQNARAYLRRGTPFIVILFSIHTRKDTYNVSGRYSINRWVSIKLYFNTVIPACYAIISLNYQLFEGHTLQYTPNLPLDPFPDRMNIAVTGAITLGRINNTSVWNDRSFDRLNNFQ